MADTSGLLRTRGEYMKAVEEGETSKSHRDWYEERSRAQPAPAEETPYNARWRNRPLTKEES